MPRILLVATLLLGVPQKAPTESPPLWVGLAAGTQAVGYRRLEGPRGPVDVWYPASEQGSRLRFTDYLGEGASGLRSFMAGAGISSGTIDSLLASRLYAAREARPAAGVLPLIIVAQGNAQDVSDQVVLCEYLASHGYAVASTPSPMIKTPMRSEDELAALAERQADDLATSVGVASTVVRVDSQRIAVVGHSFGARSALLLAMRGTPKLIALVSLDGGIGTATAAEQFRRAPSFRADALVAPILHFSETLDSFMAPDSSMLKSLRTPELVLEPTANLHHVHFTTWGFVAAVFPDVGRVTGGTVNTRGAVRDVAEKTLAFLRRRLD